MGDIDVDHVRRVLRPFWTEQPQTAARVRMRIEAGLDYATATKLRTGPQPAPWKGNLDAVLPNRSKVRAVVNHAALPRREVPAFMGRLEDRAGMGAVALRLLISTAARPGAVRGAAWREIDLDNATWTLPAPRIKARRQQRVPLSKPALRILRDVQDVADGGRLVFPSRRFGRPRSDTTLASVLKRLGRADLTLHGRRSSLRDWVGEATNHRGERAEAALAHTIRHATAAASRRGDLFEKRRIKTGRAKLGSEQAW